LLNATSGSIQWNAALEMTRPKDASAAARSSNEVTWKQTSAPVRRRRAPGGGDHRRADVDRGQPEPRTCQPLGELAGPAADFQDRSPGAEPRGRGDELHNLHRIPGAGRLIPFGDAVEQGPLAVPLVPFPLGLSSGGHGPTLRQL
jgi:hypothetical protein